MGVKGLFPYIRKYVPSCIVPTRIESLRGKRIVLDGNLLLFREFASPWLGVDQPLKHILWSLRLVRLCRKYDIYPIVVFDSAQTTPAKARERVSRSLKRARNLAQLRGTKDRASRLSLLSSTISEIGDLSEEDHVQVLSAFRRVSEFAMDAAGHKIPAEDTNGLARTAQLSNKSQQDSSTPSTAQHFPTTVISTEQVIDLAKRLTSNLESILNSPSPEASVELDILLKLTTSVTSEQSRDELHALQVDTALLVEKLTRRTVYPKYSEIRKAAIQLRKFGIPVQISPDHYEGECTAAYFVKSGYAELVASEDSDVLVYGVPQLRGFMSLRGTKDDSMSLGESKSIDPTVLRQQLAILHNLPGDMDERQFMDLSILCGTDFSRAIAQHGITKSVAKIMAYGSIEAALPHIRAVKLKSGRRTGLDKYNVHESFEEDVEVARHIFQSYPKNNKMIRRELRSKEAVDKAFSNFRRLCSLDSTWDKVEEQVLAANGMSRSDITMLDNPDIYRQHKLSESAHYHNEQHEISTFLERNSTNVPNHGLRFM